MKTTLNMITRALTIAALMSGQALAGNVSKDEKTNELVGLSSGVVIGSLIAGPVGGAIAGLFGIMIADDVNGDKRLSQGKVQLQQKEQALLVMQQRYREAETRAAILMASLDKSLEQSLPALHSNIQFKTASAKLEAHYQTELDLVAASLRSNPSLQLRVSGYADQRGDSDYNQNLSEQRAQTVKAYLLAQGVAETQINTQAFGEKVLVSSAPQAEQHFFDRRVTLDLSESSQEMTAAHP
ncbi:MAG: sortase-associated OmpA-like protein PdsO [Paraglaciecola sp.]|nr:sortase-associated OmpA-like protein PdsO [Paraglaciecola sp.]NCT47343.1 sortase-associated OmpA-like protein PdsO [Paraglaciecola sp.]